MSALERCERALARIAADERLNAWSYVANREAVLAAQASDRRRQQGQPLSPLDGRLLAIKGNIAVAGWPLEGGLRARRGLRAERDALIVARLRAAGAVLLGLTTMDEGALGADGQALTGPIHHPRAFGYSVGGSSGGSAVAVAAGHCDFALGSDTIGSIRLPAALTGIVGFKCSPGRLSTEGVLPVHPQYDHVGPLVRELDELLPVLNELGLGPDQTGESTRSTNLHTIGIVTDLESCGVDPEVAAGYRATVDYLAQHGIRLSARSLTEFEPARLRRRVFTLAEYEMWRQHGERLERHPLEYSARLTSLLRYGAGISTEQREVHELALQTFREQWAVWAQTVDFVLTPTTPVLAFAHAAPPPAALADLTALATAACVPALSAPGPKVATRSSPEGEPIGLQFIGLPGGDRALIQHAQTLSALIAASNQREL